MRRVLLPLLLLAACGSPRESAPIEPVAPPRAQSELLPSGPTAGERLELHHTWDSPDRVRFDAQLPAVAWAGSDVLRIGSGESQRWVDARTGEPRQPTVAGKPEPALAPGLAALLGRDRAAATKMLRGRSVLRRAGTTLVRRGRELFVHRGEGWRRLDWAGGRELDLDPSGWRATYVRDGDLYTLHLERGEETRHTEDGDDAGGERFHSGRLDWVYQEEVYGRGRWRGYWWSPDARHLAFLRFDQQGVPHHPLTDLLAPRPTPERMRYPKAGDPNPRVSLALLGPDGEVRAVPVPDAPEDALIVRVGWSPRGALVAAVQDRVQSWLELWSFDPDTLAASRLVREESDSWVDVTGLPRWLDDGRFLWYSDRTGTRHLELRRADGALVRDLTPGPGGVRSIVRIDDDLVFYRGWHDDPTGAHLFRVPLDGSEPPRRLTTEPGTHRVTFSPDGRLVLDRWSSLASPGDVQILDRDGRLVRVVAEAEVSSRDRFAYVAPERHRVVARDGFELDAIVFRPTSPPPAAGHPVWLSTYSGPGASTVRDRWEGDAWTQFLVSRGVVVLEVNVRSASGRGRIDTATCHRRLGVVELQDLEDTVDWLTAHPWADADRVGIRGWSYGGFMVGYALTHSDRFRLGVAGAGVYDWRLYDTIYTERYMGLPKENAEGYDATSVIRAAGDLRGHLVVVHGTQDDNVHVQNAMQLAGALQKAEQPFDLMLYPGSRHGIGNPAQRRHLRRLEWDAIREHLLDGADEAR